MLDLIKKRRSIRKYTDAAVSEDQIRAMLEAAMAAPSGHNEQPWEFIVVRDGALRQKLADTHQWAKMCARAPVVFVICGHEHESKHWIADTSAATENLLLEAAALDLGTVWIGIYPTVEYEERVRDTLDIPADVRILCLVACGHPAETKPPHTKYDPAKVHYERY